MGLDKRDAKVNKEHSSEAEKQLQCTAKCYRGVYTEEESACR